MCFGILGQAAPVPSNEVSIPPVGADLIPSPPKIPGSLPAPIDKEGGTFLPSPLDQATADVIRYCQTGYPQVCKTAIGQARMVEQVTCDGRLAVTAAQCSAGKLQQAVAQGAQFSAVKVIGIVGVAVVVGVAAGYGLGRVLP